MTKLQFDSSLDDLAIQSRSEGNGKAEPLCSRIVVKLHEATHFVMMVDYVTCKGDDCEEVL